jgi:hypothetical protein
VIALLVFHDCKNIYQSTHIIAALTTGAQSHTNTENAIILKLTTITLSVEGRNPNKKVINITHRVILNPLTAIKWVRPELLKSSLRSFGIFSLAQNKIPQRNIASCCGNIFSILDNNLCLLS